MGWGGVCTYVCANVTRPEVDHSLMSSLSCSPHFVCWDKGLIVDPALSVWPVSVRDPILSDPPHFGLQTWAAMPILLCGCWRSELRSSLHWPSPCPVSPHFIKSVFFQSDQLSFAHLPSLVNSQCPPYFIHYLAHRPPSPRELTIGLACSQWESCEASLGGTLLPPEPDLASLFSLAIRTSSWMC